MRKIVLALGMSLDGYIARPNGDIDFLAMPKDYSMASFFASVDAAIMGRKSFEAGLKLGGGKLPDMGMELYVFSLSRPSGKRDGASFVNESPEKFVRKLRQIPGKNIWLMGGGELTRAFLKNDLVDELHLGVIPVLLGAGIPLFPPGFPQRNFSLDENKSYSKGMTALRYHRLRSETRPKS